MKESWKKHLEGKFEKDDSGCWLWSNYISKNGYGQVSYKRKSYKAHRFAYEAFRGAIPEGKHIDHLCRVRHCVNPHHLEVVTQTENNRRGFGFGGINYQKTHCDNGHEYTKENTVNRKSGWRDCRICQRERYRKHYAANKERIHSRQRERYRQIAALEEE